MRGRSESTKFAPTDSHHVYRKERSMLVLSRKEGEQIAIGDDITITVVRVSHNAVRIGIEARNGANVVRRELMVPREQAAAQEPPPRGSTH